MGSLSRRFVCAVLLVCVAIGMAACRAKPVEAPKPKVAPPVISKVGVLRVGVDLSVPPLAGVDKGRKAGIDVDVASAIAGKLNLKATFVDVASSEVASALATGRIDMAMSVSLADADLTRITTAGSYVDDAPVFFAVRESTASAVPTLTLATMPAQKIAVQNGSAAYWLLASELDTESIVACDSLREALDALANGSASAAAGDALVGAYIARDNPKLAFAGTLQPTAPLAVGVSSDNSQLADAVRSVLDELDADGVLRSVRRKWLGDFPQLPSAEQTAAAL